MTTTVAQREKVFLWVKYLLLLGVGMCVPIIQTLSPQAKMWVLPPLLMMVGPGLVLLDWFSCTSPKRWQHHMESLVRGALVVWVGTQMPHGLMNTISIAVVFVMFYFLCVAAMQSQPYATVRMTMSDDSIALLAVGIAFGACVMEVTLKKWTDTSGSGLLLLLGVMLVFLGRWRHSMWYGLHLKMSPAHHADVWPAVFEKTTARTFWTHVNRYNEKYPGDVLFCMCSLSVDALLTLFDLISRNDMSHRKDLSSCNDFVHLHTAAKTVIDEKEPSAQYVWHLYDDHQAAAYIKKTLLHGTKSASCDTLELPAL